MRKLSYTSIFFLAALVFFFFNYSYAQTNGELNIESSESIKQLITKKRNHNKNLKYVKGYKVQLFYGSENNALKIKNEFSSVFPDIASELKFHSPYWKVWVGSYKTRLEADRYLAEIKEGFPSAIVVPAKVKI